MAVSRDPSGPGDMVADRESLSPWLGFAPATCSLWTIGLEGRRCQRDGEVGPGEVAVSKSGCDGCSSPSSSASGHDEKGWTRGEGGSGALFEGVGMAGGMADWMV